MLFHFSQRAGNYGLKLNFEKTKAITWNHLSQGCDNLMIAGQQVRLLAEDQSEKYLGRKLCFQNFQVAELEHRLASAWGAFHKHKSELCSKHYCLKDRVRLFEAMVSTTVLYGCCAWALTRKMEQTLVTERRRMLRYVFRCHRHASETWVEYMKRSADRIDTISAQHGLQTWTAMYRQTKWRFAGTTARRTDGRWSTTILGWKPDPKHVRDQGRPFTRWSDDIEALAGGSWQEIACDADLWASLERGYVERVF